MRTRPARQNPTASAPFSPSSARAAADAADKGRTDRALDLLLDARWGPGWRDRLPRPRLAATLPHARLATAAELPETPLTGTTASSLASVILTFLVANHPPDQASAP